MGRQKIFLGADHAGFKLKEEVKKYLEKEGFEVEDEGAHSHDKNDDYPDFIVPVAKKVVENPRTKGIIFGASGQGEAIAANRISGARAALYYGGSMEIVRLSRTHNNANILSLGARLEAVRLWLKTGFSGEERHTRRINKIDI